MSSGTCRKTNSLMVLMGLLKSYSHWMEGGFVPVEGTPVFHGVFE